MNRRIISIPGVLALALVLALPSSGEGGTPPRPKPSVWIGTGGAVGEAATVQVRYPGQNCPYALVYSPQANPAGSWPPILPPYGLLASGSLDAQGGASIPVRVPAASGLVGLHIHLVAAVDDLPSFGRSYSAVCLWAVAPPHPRRFVAIPGPKPIPFLPTDGHARANLQSGQVLFSGGNTGGYMPPTRIDAWLYDPVAMTAVRVGNMTTMRQGHVAQPLGDGTVLVSGGDWAASQPTAELYNPTTRSFQSLGAVPFALCGSTATLLRAPGTGREYVLIAGGTDGVTPSSQAMLYDASNRNFVALPPMKRARRMAAAVAFPSVGAVLITGGQDAQYASLDHAELFLLATRQFYDWGRTVRPRTGHAMIRLDRTHALILGGGTTLAACREIEVFSGLNRAAYLLPPPVRLRLPRDGFKAIKQADGSILVAGSPAFRYPNPGRTPELLTATGSTLLRPVAEPGETVMLHQLLNGGVLAIGQSRVHKLQ